MLWRTKSASEMSGDRIVSDTNPLIYLVDGNEEAGQHLDQRECWVSEITELEIFGKKNLRASDKKEIDLLLASCFIIDLQPGIKDIVKSLQQSTNLKLPDAIIAATALYLDLPLLTADRVFKQVAGLELMLLTF